MGRFVEVAEAGELKDGEMKKFCVEGLEPGLSSRARTITASSTWPAVPWSAGPT
jgi:hypothetical protein